MVEELYSSETGVSDEMRIIYFTLYSARVYIGKAYFDYVYNPSDLYEERRGELLSYMSHEGLLLDTSCYICRLQAKGALSRSCTRITMKSIFYVPYHRIVKSKTRPSNKPIMLLHCILKPNPILANKPVNNIVIYRLVSKQTSVYHT